MSENVNLSHLAANENNEKIAPKKGIRAEKEHTFTVDDAVNLAGYGRFQIRLLIFAGLGWAADACEIFILSVIGNFMACDWPLYQWQIAMLTSIVFGGISIGSPILGVIADKYGRKKCLSLSLVVLAVCGAVSAASPSYAWMVVLRGCLGMAVGGVSQGLILCTEYCPTHIRGKAGFYLCYFWSLGTVGVILMVWVVMEHLDSWRVLLAVVALPCVVVVLSLPWYPESARFLVVSGRHDEAVGVLSEMARLNKTGLPLGTLVRVDEGAAAAPRGRLLDLLTDDYRTTSLLFWYIWFATAFAYYGIALVSPLIVQRGSLITSSGGNSSGEAFFRGMGELVPCSRFTQQNYVDLLWTSAAEFPGLIVFTFLVERCGRKVLLGVSCFVTSLLVLLLLLRTHKVVILLILFAARGIILAVFQLIYIVASETYPTTFRSVAIGFGSAFCRIGGLVVPYVAQVLVLESPVSAMCLMSSVLFLSAVASFLLPYETKGARMKESQMKNK